MRIEVPPETAKKFVAAMLRAKGGLTALAAGNVPAIVDEWTANGVGLTIDSDSPLAESLYRRGWLERPKEG